MPLTIVDTRSPIKVTGTTSSDTEIWDADIFIKFLYWYKPTTIGHLLALKDGSGDDIIPLRCEVADGSQFIPIFTKFKGIHIDDMDSGVLYIYHP